MPAGQALNLLGQLIGGCATVVMLLSFQFKTLKRLYFCRMLSAVLFLIQYVLIGGYTGAMMNAVGAFCCLVLCLGKPWGRSRKMMLVTLGISALFGILTYSGPVSLLPVAVVLLSTVVLWTGNNIWIHAAQLLLFSPAWLVYNIVFRSYSGAAAECFNILSVIIFLFVCGLQRKSIRLKKNNKKNRSVDFRLGTVCILQIFSRLCGRS